MKNIIGPIVSMLIECKISDVHLKIFIICRNGVIKLMMKKVGLNVNIKWTVYTRIHLLKYYLIHCSTRCMNVPTEQVKINLDVKRKKKFVRIGIVLKREKCIKRVLQKECQLDFLQMKVWTGMKNKCMNTSLYLDNPSKVKILRTSQTKKLRKMRAKNKFKH